MRALRLLVCDGNVADLRREMKDASGFTSGEAYAETLRGLQPDSRVDIVCPSDDNAAASAPLESYDGVAITGSALNIYRAEPAALRQIEFARGVFAAGLPFFGSCWGLQVATVAAGGEVVLNPRGPEVGFARKVFLTDAGRGHPMHMGRDLAFDAPAVHSDMVSRLPAGAVATAWNTEAAVQAAEIRWGAGTFWGVQYHPEYTLADVAAIIQRYGQRLVTQGFFTDLVSLSAYVADLTALHGEPKRFDIAWKLGLGGEVLDPSRRLCEISNWLNHHVGPTASARGRL